MGWRKLFDSINEEVNVNAPVIKRKKRGDTLFEKIAQEVIDGRIDEIDVGAAAKKVGTAVKTGWRKLAGKIKEVANIGFTKFGYAIGKLVSGGFVLFNRAGDILTPPAKNIEIKKMAGIGQKALAMTYRNKAGDIDLFMNDKLDFGFGTQITNFGAGAMFIAEPKSPGLKEGIDYNNPLLEDEKEDIGAMQDVDNLVFNSFAGAGSEALEKETDYTIAKVKVDYDAFRKELGYLMDVVKEGNVMQGSKIKNLAIYAPTGWGKSQIIGSIAEEKGFHFFPLELQKVDINLISGFPYLEDIEDASEDVKEDRLRRAKKVVKMAPSEFLPPSGHTGNWLLFFDEFNRADMEKMSAVMNLLLTGELGGAANLIKSGSDKEKLDRYRLPEKVVIVLAMNTGEQNNIEDSVNLVNDMDIATLERVHRVLHGQYHAPSWFRNFALKGLYTKDKAGNDIVTGERIPPIILNFLNDVMKKKGGVDVEAPFLLPISVAGGSPGTGGGQRTASPRSWTMVADAMIEMGFKHFQQLTPEAKEKYRDDAQRIKKELGDKEVVDGKGKKITPPANDDDYLFAAYMRAAPNQIRLLAAQSPELGDEGEEYVSKMISSFIKKGRSGVSIEDVLLNYKQVQPIVKKSFATLGFGSKSRFLAQAYNTLSRFKTEQQIKDFMEDKGLPILSKKGPVEQIYLTVKTMYKDLDFAEDDFATFTHLVEDGAKTGDSEVLKSLHSKLANWEVYKENLIKKLKTKSQVEKELQKLTGKKGEGDDEGEDESNEELVKFFKGLNL